MSDAAGFGEVLATARLLREIDPGECQRRNALTNKRADLRLRQGSVVTVLESLDQGNAFLVEFGEKREGRPKSSSRARKGEGRRGDPLNSSVSDGCAPRRGAKAAAVPGRMADTGEKR
jgi:hypothetical protein